MDVVELTGAGAEISGVDMGNLSQRELDDLRQAFSDYGLLFFRDQQLDEEQHIAFAARWGEININRFFEAHPDHPQIALVRKEPDQQANIGGGWHTDHSYDEEPALGSILVARELPASGGDTCFCDLHKVWDSLSNGLKDTLTGLQAVHSSRHIFGSSAGYAESEDTGQRISNAGQADELADVVHPVIIRHPLSGRETLYVNPGFTLRFDGWTREESLPLLKYLYQLAPQDPFVTRFKWKPGSVAFWDNRATWHMALNDYQGQRRLMHRITLEGEALQH
jgi:taurine dioxygenase